MRRRRPKLQFWSQIDFVAVWGSGVEMPPVPADVGERVFNEKHSRH